MLNIMTRHICGHFAHLINIEMVGMVTYLVSSTTSTSAGAVIGSMERPPAGSSPGNSPLVELTTCHKQ